MFVFSLLGIIVLIVFPAALLLFVYYLIYTNRINKKIQSGEITGRRLVDIPKMVMTAVITVLLILCLIFYGSAQDANLARGTVVRNNYAVIDFSDPDDLKYAGYFGGTELDDASFAGVYSIDENPGYEKEVTVDGDYTFTLFKRTSPADSFHPDFLCFVEYTGDDQDEIVVYYMSTFENPTIKDGTFGIETGGGYVSDKLLYIGNLDEGYDFTLGISLMDDEAKKAYSDASEKGMADDNGQFLKARDFALDYSEIRISFHE